MDREAVGVGGLPVIQFRYAHLADALGPGVRECGDQRGDGWETRQTVFEIRRGTLDVGDPAVHEPVEKGAAAQQDRPVLKYNPPEPNLGTTNQLATPDQNLAIGGSGEAGQIHRWREGGPSLARECCVEGAEPPEAIDKSLIDEVIRGPRRP